MNILKSGDARQAYKAGWDLVQGGSATVRFLSNRLTPARAVPVTRVRPLVNRLTNRSFKTRQSAQQALAEMGELAYPVLRQQLKRKSSLELRKRIQLLLPMKGQLTQRQLQSTRALAVLERIGTPKAVRLLQKLATGASNAWLTRQAREAVVRTMASSHGNTRQLSGSIKEP